MSNIIYIKTKPKIQLDERVVKKNEELKKLFSNTRYNKMFETLDTMSDEIKKTLCDYILKDLRYWMIESGKNITDVYDEYIDSYIGRDSFYNILNPKRRWIHNFDTVLDVVLIVKDNIPIEEWEDMALDREAADIRKRRAVAKLRQESIKRQEAELRKSQRLLEADLADIDKAYQHNYKKRIAQRHAQIKALGKNNKKNKKSETAKNGFLYI